MLGSVELKVREDGADTLVYTFKTVSEAGEMINFLTDFFPAATFIVQPLTH